jgi:hypothetical protein
MKWRRRIVKKAVELIKSVISLLRTTYSHTHQICIETLELALSELQSSRQETPEQYGKRTGEPWPNDWAVYYRTRYKPTIFDPERWTIWLTGKYKNIKKRAKHERVQMVCATEAGSPPDGWEPEGEEP